MIKTLSALVAIVTITNSAQAGLFDGFTENKKAAFALYAGGAFAFVWAPHIAGLCNDTYNMAANTVRAEPERPLYPLQVREQWTSTQLIRVAGFTGIATGVYLFMNGKK
ncbi:MAG: hypothetical protein WCE21_05895 [Candidatus Babeliales bacterium]